MHYRSREPGTVEDRLGALLAGAATAIEKDITHTLAPEVRFDPRNQREEELRHLEHLCASTLENKETWPL